MIRYAARSADSGNMRGSVPALGKRRKLAELGSPAQKLLPSRIREWAATEVRTAFAERPQSSVGVHVSES